MVKTATASSLRSTDSEERVEYEGENLTVKEILERKQWIIKDYLQKRIANGETQYFCQWQDTWETYEVIEAFERRRIKGYKVVETKEEIRGTSSVTTLRCEWEPRWVAESCLNTESKEQAAEHFRPPKRQRTSDAAKRSVPNQEVIDLIDSDSSLSMSDSIDLTNAKPDDDSQSDQRSDELAEEPVGREARAQEMESLDGYMEGNEIVEEQVSFAAPNDDNSLCREVYNLDLNDEDLNDEYGTVPPAIGSLYKRRDGTIFGIRSVDKQKREATCHEFHPFDEYENNGKYDKDGFAVLRFNELPLSCLLKDWVYDFDPAIKFEFTIKKEGRKKKINNRRRRLRTLELFAGAGGMSLGLLKAKFDIRWAVEKENKPAATLRSNLSKANVYEETVSNFLQRARECNTAYPEQDEVDHIHASPPCQGFSLANRYGGADDEPNNEQSFVFVDCVHHFRPKTVTYENVMGLARTKKNRPFLEKIVANLHCFGYQIRVCVLNARDYGDAQNRERLIIFGAKEDMQLPLKPEPTCGKLPLMKVRTVGDAIGFLAEYEPFIPDSKGTIIDDGVLIGDHCVRNTKNLPDENHPDNTKLSMDSLAPTAKCDNRFIHPTLDRFLSVREYACLQSFPVHWTFCGSQVEKFRQIGNAVPVHMATHIARSVSQAHGFP